MHERIEVAKVGIKARYHLIAVGLLVVCTVIGAVFALARRSPTGRIVYVVGYASLYVMDADGDNVQRLTGDCITRSISPVWSPDGKSVAFACSVGGTRNLCITDMEEMQALRCSDYGGILNHDKLPVRCIETIHSVSWSPDGQRLAFTCSAQDRETFICIVTMDGETDCWLASAISGGYESIRDDEASVDWSPTQDRLAVSMELPYFGDSIFLTDIDGQNSHFLVQGRDPSWSPDGKQIAFFRDLDGLYLIDQDGYESHSIYTYSRHPGREPNKTLPGFTSRPVWSPDGRFIAFAGTRNPSGGYSGVYLMDLKTREIRRITEVDVGEVDDPDWSP